MGRKGGSTGGGLPPSPRACAFYLPSHGLRRGLHIYRLLRRLTGAFHGGDHAVVNFGLNQRSLKFPTRVPTGRQMDPGWGERASARGEVCRPLRGLASSACLPTACAVGYMSTASFGGSQVPSTACAVGYISTASFVPSHGLRRGLHIYRLLRRLTAPSRRGSCRGEFWS